jgi:large subunit ribosomal protein L4
MQIKTYKGGAVGERAFDESPFHDKGGKARVLYRTLKDAVVMFQANQRMGSANTRGRDQVRGSNKKPWKQKHTGRARAGDRKSPIWRGGGTVFGPKTRDWSYHMPAKARRVATRTAFLGKLRDGEVVVADLGGFDGPSARTARKVLGDLGSPRRAVIVLAQPDEAVWKSFRNFPGVKVRTADELCAFDLVAGGLVVAQEGALEKLTARVGATTGGDA